MWPNIAFCVVMLLAQAEPETERGLKGRRWWSPNHRPTILYLENPSPFLEETPEDELSAEQLEHKRLSRVWLESALVLSREFLDKIDRGRKLSVEADRKHVLRSIASLIRFRAGASPQLLSDASPANLPDSRAALTCSQPAAASRKYLPSTRVLLKDLESLDSKHEEDASDWVTGFLIAEDKLKPEHKFVGRVKNYADTEVLLCVLEEALKAPNLAKHQRRILESRYQAALKKFGQLQAIEPASD
ncbi:MAG: hypothetical protein DCC75_11325 [Proteobacteria bacterium]|nr:MAG: hypothetical protein DCC75_11325 [Pseudomonadota bacterium]